MGNSIIRSEETQSTEQSKGNQKVSRDEKGNSGQIKGAKKFGSPYTIKPPNITDFKQKN